MKIDTLDAVSPLDGRYRKKVQALGAIFGERGLIGYRTEVEARYLIALSEHESVETLRQFTPKERLRIESLPARARRDAKIIKAYETKGRLGRKKTNHDVAALVIYIQEALAKTSLADATGWVHFALTSEDVNNIAYAFQLREALENVLIPELEMVCDKIEAAAVRYHELAMLSRTHGQPASPTTLGKEFRVFANRLRRQLNKLKRQTILVKLNGASGNYNAHIAAFPKVDWIGFTRSFIGKFNLRRKNPGTKGIRLVPNLVTTQIEPHDTYAELFDRVKRINTILIALCQDNWRYISDEWLVQKTVPGEHGSSTMPAKVNPIDHENGEGNLIWAVGMCEVFSRVLPISRLQRHLSDSTIIRNFGVAFAHSLLAYKAIQTGLDKISANSAKIAKDLSCRVEVLAEPIQIILRREGIGDAYEKLRELTRGKKFSLQDMRTFVHGLKVKQPVKKELLALRPKNYTGKASHLALFE